jgi:hypothetical protein
LIRVINYRGLYQEKWIKNLEELRKRCVGMKELEIVKGDVDMLLKESKEQHEILKRSQELVAGRADKMFIQPILEYYILMNIYFAFFNVVGKDDIKECCRERDSISEEEKREIEKLVRQELLKSARDACSELASELTRSKKSKLANQGKEDRLKELGKVLFKLEHAVTLLEEGFKVNETLKEREEKRIEGEREERRQKLRELRERTEQDVQARQEVEQRAGREAQRVRQLEQALEQKILEGIAIRACARKLTRLDEELQDAVNKESEEKIVEAAISCARGSPEQVIDAIIEEIKINRDQIIKEGRVSAEIIEAGIRSFSN